MAKLQSNMCIYPSTPMLMIVIISPSSGSTCPVGVTALRAVYRCPLVSESLGPTARSAMTPIQPPTPSKSSASVGVTALRAVYRYPLVSESPGPTARSAMTPIHPQRPANHPPRRGNGSPSRLPVPSPPLNLPTPGIVAAIILLRSIRKPLNVSIRSSIAIADVCSWLSSVAADV